MHDNSLDEKLKQWFNSTGTPLEIETARQFFLNGFGIEHSAVYSDPETHSSREIDVLAYRSDHTVCFEVIYAIECKATGKPWVVLTDPEQYDRYGALWIALMSPDAREAMSVHMNQYLGIYHSIFGEANGGYALRQAFSGQDDHAYKACMSVLKAAINLAADDCQSIIFVIPTIVVDAPIFEYRQEIDGEQVFSPVSSSSFVFSAHIGSRQRCVIRIVSKDSLKEHALKCRLVVDQYQSLFEQETMRLFHSGI